MRPFNPFMQRRNKNVEVILKSCPVCHGSGSIMEEGTEMICSNCAGSGEIAQKITNTVIKNNPK